jgi:hypothetical protein
VKALFKNLALLIIGSVFTAQALASEAILGDYQGKVSMVKDYRSRVDETCRVIISASDLYGGSLNFEILGAEKLTIEERRVDSDLKPGKSVIKWISPRSYNKPIEVIVLELRNDGSLKSLKLILKDPTRHQEKFIVCDELTRGT